MRTLIILIILFSIAIVSQPLVAAKDKPDKADRTARKTQSLATTGTTTGLALFEAKTTQKDGVTLPYRILYPENMKPGEKYPLFLYMPGIGKRGTDNVQQLDRSALLLLEPQNRKQYPCIALYPELPATVQGSYFNIYDKDGKQYTGSFADYSKVEEKQKTKPSIKISPYGLMLIDLINQLIADGKADPRRIYITGSSMGGFSTFLFITAYPGMFAAAAPIASAMNPDDTAPWLGKVPIWIRHGDGDRDHTLTAAPAIVEKLKASGYKDWNYTVYKNTAHNSWDTAFADPDYLKWIFAHSK